MKCKIKKGDFVKVIAGNDKNKVGEVLKVDPKNSLVLVKGINLVKKHRKATQQNPGSIDIIEKPVHVSNVAFFDNDDKISTKISLQKIEDGTKQRVGRKTKKVY
ncbi:ribosomal protein L24 bacterial/organelle [Candidatus Phycorickettsia trachydisci]|uniref:Large ribosomal subunit protein uL24 n=1 Tax=Candidatus Phycorickettsia trachydisci TaxID=2115978 RepID=A0A2P1P8X4_9RICK|nr:50S ribosomal protein L24 [Candidatus Phycorickettsia trachydisci]AVP87722.1 ribosomal protein L24 bacterial/organelle [Candidatus Phycorickettsia trachydisci]